MTTQIELEGLTKTYKLDRIAVNALHDVNLNIDTGELVAILGPSGSGKTTLLNMIGGIDRPSSGKLTVLDKQLNQLSESALTRFRKDHLAYVFQFYSLVPSLTALENVMMVLELIGVKGRQLHEDALSMLELVGLEDRANNFPFQLSGGERQRVAIARALAKRPRILFADEPSGQLDTKTGHAVVSQMADICREHGTTMLMVTHDHSLTKYVERVLEIDSGQIVSDTLKKED